MTVLTRIEQRRVVEQIGIHGVDVGSMGDKGFDDVEMPVLTGIDDGGASVFVGDIHRFALVEQGIHNIGVAL